MWVLAAVAVAIVVILWVLRGLPELAKLELEKGEVRLVRGRMPGRLLDDFRDVLKGSPAERAVVTISVESGRPRVVASGLDEGRLQQLRNVLGPYQVAQIRAGARAARRSAR